MSRPLIPRPKLNLIELCLFAGLIAFLGYQGGRGRTERRLQPFLSRAGAELQVLENRYGPGRSSRYGEEWIVRDFFRDERDGVFVDVGANHYQRDSNTYFLETALGWRGVAIEPQAKFAADYQRHRPRTQFVPLFVSDRSNSTVLLHVPGNDLIASASKAFVEREGGGTDPVAIKVQTTTLDDALTRSGLDRLDFLSIDVELHEPEVLRGFSIDRWKPRLVCVEAQPEVRQVVIDSLMSHGYRPIGKYLRADTENLWFARTQ